MQAIAKVSFVPKKGALWSKWSAEKERLMVGLTVEGGRDESEGGVEDPEHRFWSSGPH